MSFNCDSGKFKLPEHFYTHNLTPEKCDMLKNLCSSHRCFRAECQRYNVVSECSAVKQKQLEKFVFDNIQKIIFKALNGGIRWRHPLSFRINGRVVHPFHWSGALDMPIHTLSDPERTIVESKEFEVAFWPHFHVVFSNVKYTVYVFPEHYGKEEIESLCIAVVKTEEFSQYVLTRMNYLDSPALFQSAAVLPEQREDLQDIEQSETFSSFEGPAMIADSVSAITQAIMNNARSGLVL